MNDTAYERITTALRDHGCKVVERGGEKASTTCPHHEDRNPSVSVTGINGRVLVWCHAGCDTRDVLFAVGLEPADLFDERSATYQYDDGRTVRRYYDQQGKKKFKQNGAGATSTLYRLNRIRDTPPGRSIYLVEGEEDVRAIEAEGEVATTAPQGADSFHKVDVAPLAGHWVTVVVDRDPPGAKWAQQVAEKLEGVAAKYRFVQARAGKDAADHIAAGHSLADFEPYRPPETPDPGGDVTLTKASAIGMLGVRWLYHGRIPAGMVTLLAGREGIGKSTVSLDIAARLTRGALPGRHQGRPRNVVICATEDSWSHTIVPRLLAVGADMDRVFHVAVRERDGRTRSIVAPTDVARMERAFRECQPALMLIDPLMAIIDGKIDTHKQAEVQQALEPLVKLCERIDMAVLALIHVNKSGTTDPLNSIMGSKAFATLPRSILYCLEEEDGRFMFCHVKCNVGPRMPSTAYRLQSVRFELPPEQVDEGDYPYVESSKVIWGEDDPRSATELLEERASRSNLGDAARAVLEVIDNEAGVITTQQIKTKLPRVDAKAIENALLRLAKSDRIVHVQRGVYQSLRVTPD